MSGGTWGYKWGRFNELADKVKDEYGTGQIERSLRTLGEVEHVLDWGHAYDTCLACARREAILLLENFFYSAGWEVPKSHDSYYTPEFKCNECLKRISEYKPNKYFTQEQLDAIKAEIKKRKDPKYDRW